MASLPLPRHKLSVEQFHEMGRAGILREDSRVELIEGELIDMAPIGSLHASVVNTLSMLFSQFRQIAIVATQNPVTLQPYNEPQPDIALLRPKPDRYRDALPSAQDVLLVIEVADTSLQYDRTVKLSLYARHGIRETWIVNLAERKLEIYRQPGDGRYRAKLERQAADTVSPEALPMVSVDLTDVLSDAS